MYKHIFRREGIMQKCRDFVFSRISSLEMRRQLFHLFFGIAIVILLYLNILTKFYLAVLLSFGILLSIVCARHNLPVISWFLNRFEREEYRWRFPGKGAILLVLGSLIVLLLFPKNIALAAILMLSIGDALAHLFGKLLSRRKYTYLKSAEGTIIGIITGFLGALIFVNPLTAAIGSFAAMGSEAVKTKLLDDNILIPLVAGAVMWLVVVGL